MSSNIKRTPNPLILIALSEGALVLIGIGICFWSSIWPNWNITLKTSLIGIATGIMLYFILKYVADIASKSSARWAKEVVQLKEDFAKPIARSLSAKQAIISAILAAILAGGAEEFFFRGTIENLLPAFWGTLIGGIAFVILHFGRKTLEWRFISLIYLTVSFLFSAIFQLSNSLWAAALCHGIYDYLAIRLLAKQD